MSVTDREMGASKAPQKKLGSPTGSVATVPPHVACLKKTDVTLSTADGKPIALWQLSVPTDAALLSDWARRFRQHYCLDEEIDALRAGTGLSRADYLRELIFPDEKAAPGPSIRAGDFAEILVADYIEHVQGYWVPRGKYAEKAVRNESIKGVDILGFKALVSGSDSPADELLAFEVKAQLTDGTYSGRLQDAIDHSRADYLRRGMTLNATKRRLIQQKDPRAAVVQRFQNPVDHPYTYRSGAAAVLSEGAYDAAALGSSSVSGHPNQHHIELIVIRGADLMTLAHAIYLRAGHEA